MPYTIGIQSDANVPPKQVHTILPCLIGKLVLLKAAQTGQVAICRVYQSSIQPGRFDILFCGESTARRVGASGREFEAEIKYISTLLALFREPAATYGLLGVGFALLAAFLAVAGIFWIPHTWDSPWKLVVAASAAMASFFGLLNTCRNTLP